MSNTSPNNPWFAATMLLTGLIVGYVASSVTGYAPMGAGAKGGTQVAAQPTAPDAPEPEAPPAPTDVPAIGEGDHVRGNKNAAVTIIEYSDFECPFCKRHHPTMEKVVKEYGDDVNWVYRHFPLSFHPNAMPSAIASECAYKIGGGDAFWKMADELIASEDYDFEAMATKIGLSATSMKDCMDNDAEAMEQKITDQADAGAAAGVGGTPGNFIVFNDDCDDESCPGIEISGAVPFATFKAQIDKLLE